MFGRCGTGLRDTKAKIIERKKSELLRKYENVSQVGKKRIEEEQPNQCYHYYYERNSRTYFFTLKKQT